MTETRRRLGSDCLGSDLAKVEARRITPKDYDEIPELTDANFARGVVSKAGRPVGRPRSPNPKQAIKLRLSPTVVTYFRATGRGWQTRINETLERVVNGELKERRPSRSAARKQK
jgi:uncharacterized protein (DUF4415 family)